MGISNTCHDDFMKPNLLQGRKVQEGEGLFVVFFRHLISVWISDSLKILFHINYLY